MRYLNWKDVYIKNHQWLLLTSLECLLKKFFKVLWQATRWRCLFGTSLVTFVSRKDTSHKHLIWQHVETVLTWKKWNQEWRCTQPLDLYLFTRYFCSMLERDFIFSSVHILWVVHSVVLLVLMMDFLKILFFFSTNLNYIVSINFKILFRSIL